MRCVRTFLTAYNELKDTRLRELSEMSHAGSESGLTVADQTLTTKFVQSIYKSTDVYVHLSSDTNLHEHQYAAMAEAMTP